MFGEQITCGEAKLDPPANLVCLVPVCESHLAAYARWRQDPAVMKWMGRPLDRPDQIMSWYERRRDDERSMFWSIVISERVVSQELLVGVVGITNIDHSTMVGGVSIMIGEKGVWGKGVATVTLAAVVKYARDTFHLRGLRLEAMMPNVGCIKAAESTGFTKCGVWPDMYLIDDEYVDLWLGYLRLSE